MAPLGRPPVMLDIVEEHFEELDFLWELREGVIFAPDWNLDELAELEERAEAHLDGLRLAELHAVDIARPHLVGEHKFAATAATFVMMETGEEEFFAEVLKAFVEAKAEARDGIRIGLRHSKIDSIETKLFELAKIGAPAVRAAAADVLAFHRRAVPEIRDLLGVDDDGVRIHVYGALGRGNAPLELALAEEGLKAKAPEVRRAMLEAAARSGMLQLHELSRRAATRQNVPDPEALYFLGVLGSSASLVLITESLARPELSMAALRGLGALGRVEAVPVLLQAMETPELAPAAGAAFQRITGADDIAEPRPERPPGSSTDAPAEFADATPGPDAAKARVWWDAWKKGRRIESRWQAGCEVGADALGPEFSGLPLRVRRDLYLAARAAKGAGQPDLELERRARLQASGR